MRGCVILYDDIHHLDDLFYYNLLFRKLRFWGSGTLDLALGTFGTFTSWGIRQFLIVIFRLLVVLVVY